MVSRAVAKYVRVSPRKVRQVIDLIRGKDARAALVILSGLNKGATRYVEQALKSAISNAERKLNLKSPKLYISRITADGGPMLKRYRAAPMGSAVVIRKRTCHITVELDRKETEDRKQKTENRRQKTENRRKKAKDKGQIKI